MSCPICLSSVTTVQPFVGRDFLFETTSRTFAFSSCESCRCSFIDTLPGNQELATFYPAQYWWSSSSRRLKILEGIYRRIALRDHVAFITAATPLLKQSARLLDIGCGSGTLLALLKQA